ncbi:hypothetical protein [Actinoplanes derwentensis]|nr:hypothetical protein [Actinoplanes derwentensis]
MVVLATAGCTDTDEPVNPGASASSAPTSMTFDEVYRILPMDGTRDLPISWDLSQVQDTDEILAARRSLAFLKWLDASTDWPSVIPIGRFLFTERSYQATLEPFINATDTNDPRIGPIWVKTVGVETNGPDQVTVTFCTDIGYWRNTSEKSQVRRDRANLESYEMHYVQTSDGQRRWLADRVSANDGKRGPKYDAECTKWAQHQP